MAIASKINIPLHRDIYEKSYECLNFYGKLNIRYRWRHHKVEK